MVMVTTPPLMPPACGPALTGVPHGEPGDDRCDPVAGSVDPVVFFGDNQAESRVLTGGKGVTIRLVLLVGLVVTAFAYLGFRIWTSQGHEPLPASWAALIVLVFMACGVFFAGLPVRRFLRGQSKKTLNPIRAMRTVVLAQASALTGALVTGWYLAQILVLLPDADVASRRALMWRLAALAAGGILMVVAGLVVQGMCRVDKDNRGSEDDQDRDGDEEPNSNHDY